MTGIRHQLYGIIVQLHPRGFRKEFGPEMELDFAEALPSTGFAALCLDALRSLLRQWAESVWSLLPERAPAAGNSLLAGHYVELTQPGPSVLDLTRGTILFLICLLILARVASIEHHRIAANPQSGLASSPSMSMPDAGSESGDGRSASATGTARSRRARADQEQNTNQQTGDARGNVRNARSWTRSAAERPSRMLEISSPRGPWPWLIWAVVLWVLASLWIYFPGFTRRLVFAGLSLLLLLAPPAFGMVWPM